MFTEKTLRLMEQNQYTFTVCSQLSKRQIRQIIEKLYGVAIVGINTYRPARRQRRGAKFSGYRPTHKRAIVRLAAGQTLTNIDKAGL
uniref:Large ribosomal subunit protein uL23c n=1 Tax=Pseudobryopsis hainanensis TaxID=2320808 RepID=A0A3S5X1K9_9CHLO|nr:ribosomal protein L23 [Pseudobryopsis hainanensis]